MFALCLVLGLHIFWLIFIWGVPVIGIGVAGARFSRGENFFLREK